MENGLDFVAVSSGGKMGGAPDKAFISGAAERLHEGARHPGCDACGARAKPEVAAL